MIFQLKMYGKVETWRYEADEIRLYFPVPRDRPALKIKINFFFD
jgi:hypothetical protein